MESKVAILHRSVIVRRGLAALISPLWKKEIVQSDNIDHFLEKEYCRKCHLLLFIEAGIAERLITEWDNLKTRMIFVYDDESRVETHSPNLGAISLYSDFSRLEAIFTEFSEQDTRRDSSDNELTHREKEILRQVAMGYSNKEIAEGLHISIHTVITHRKNITSKLGIKSISGLTVYAIINRMIDPDLIDPEKLI